mmetsp:Transcript_32789/g.88024  ORF Transcript_32789/g.88024 Transcript_32789/m.88024 type:complete len:200 (-) Transcript_32789:142-741(-)
MACVTQTHLLAFVVPPVNTYTNALVGVVGASPSDITPASFRALAMPRSCTRIAASTSLTERMGRSETPASRAKAAPLVASAINAKGFKLRRLCWFLSFSRNLSAMSPESAITGRPNRHAPKQSAKNSRLLGNQTAKGRGASGCSAGCIQMGALLPRNPFWLSTAAARKEASLSCAYVQTPSASSTAAALPCVVAKWSTT